MELLFRNCIAVNMLGYVYNESPFQKMRLIFRNCLAVKRLKQNIQHITGPSKFVTCSHEDNAVRYAALMIKLSADLLQELKKNPQAILQILRQLLLLHSYPRGLK